MTSTATDENGLFELDLTRAATDEEIMAIKANHRPATEEKPPNGWPEFVELVLGGPPLEIAGRVIDHEGKPVPKLRMWIDDPSPFGLVGRMPMYAENVMAGAPVPPLATESVAFLPKEDGDDYWDYTTRPGPPSAFWNWIETDGNGRFVMPGLEDRHYRLRMMHDETLAAHSTEPIRAGRDDVTVQLPKPKLHRRLKGRVVTEAGIPIAGARVRLSRTAFDRRSRVFGGTTYVGLVQPRESVMSDEDGRFAFEDVPKVGAKSDGVLGPHRSRFPPAHRRRGPEGPRDHRRGPLPRRRAPRTAHEPRSAARIGFADRDGERLDVLVIRDGSFNAYTSVPLVDGRSGVVSVSSTAGELLLLDTDEELVEGMPITLVPGEVTVLQP